MIFVHPSQEQFLRTLLKLILRIMSRHERLFSHQRFFRSLGYLFVTLDVNYFTLDCAELLYKMYNQLKDQSIRVEMLRHVFSNLSVWNNMSQQNQFFVFSCVFPGLLQVDCANFVETISFGDLLMQFTQKFSGESNDRELMQRCWNFLTFWRRVNL
jgi:hypothetical protein